MTPLIIIATSIVVVVTVPVMVRLATRETSMLVRWLAWAALVSGSAALTWVVVFVLASIR